MKTPRNKLIRAHFNLIEIALALGVLSIGLMGTLGLFSVGLNSNREAIGRNYSADAADEILHRLAVGLRQDWEGRRDQYPDDPPDISAGAGDIDDWADVDKTAGNMFYRDYSGETVYRIYQESDSTEPVVDFDAMVRIWRTPSEAWEYDPDTDSWASVIDTTYERRLILNIEMSWPALLPFHARQKTYFTMEVARDND